MSGASEGGDRTIAHKIAHAVTVIAQKKSTAPMLWPVSYKKSNLRHYTAHALGSLLLSSHRINGRTAGDQQCIGNDV